jgi:hypothetical protein
MQRTKGMQMSGNGRGSHPLREVGGHLSEQLVPWFVIEGFTCYEPNLGKNQALGKPKFFTN